ncbi:unnamed protein product [Medioppia subpectinata]|uniref:Uncharacterized protein n=1 Tax=Medioppia subpectinata TaxID=1979941 RepID=A0A7R9KTC6_9ACAR|nr:unnamed protein product [Medioppia subpectinata]CAG2108290.1 unnamed protein product [Medioppia subpectinata]
MIIETVSEMYRKRPSCPNANAKPSNDCINGQTLPPLETLPTDSSSTGLSGVNGMNMSSIYSPFDECCLNSANNSLDDPNVVYIGAVALNMDNECQVVCQIQILQSFSLAIGPFL